MGEFDRRMRDSIHPNLEDRSRPPNSDLESGHQITFIPAKILNVDKQADKPRVIVRVLLREYRGSFDTLIFGENEPLIGSCHAGRLDLIYPRDLGLKEGQPFPLWTIQ
jgi:hypothetical protein